MLGWIRTGWGLASGFVTSHIRMIGVVSVVLAVASVAASVWLYVRGAERAKAQVPVLEAMLSHAEVNARRNGAAFEACSAANTANALEAARQKEKAREAELRLVEATTHANRDVEDTEREANKFRSAGLECPAITPAFRQWVRGDP